MYKTAWHLIPFLLFLGLSIFLWRGLSLDPHELPSVQLGKVLPQFKLPLLKDPAVLFHSRELPKKVLLLNVWASWCFACIEEQAFLMKLAREGVSIYGLNYKDKTESALEWLTQWGDPYQLVVQDKEGTVGIDLGVYGAPETFVVDKQGIIRYRHAGLMTEALWNQQIKSLIVELDRPS